MCRNKELWKLKWRLGGQSSNPMWHDYRKTHMTANIFHTVCHLISKTLVKYSSQILNKNLVQTRAMTHGIINEKVTIKRWRDGYGDLWTGQIIEIKCLYASRNEEIRPVTIPYIYNMMTINNSL